MTSLTTVAALLLLHATCTWAQPAPGCETGSALASSDPKHAKFAGKAQATNWQVRGAQCASLQGVLRMATRERRVAASQHKQGTGRADAAAAAAEIQALRSDPAAAAELDALAGHPDPWVRALLEAALFDTAGKYSARDLRIEQARALAEAQ